MAEPLRQPPAVSENKDPRSWEYFYKDLYDHLVLVGRRTLDVASIAAGGKQTFTITVTGCRPNKGQTVQVGLPSSINADLLPWGFVSANDEVTVVLRNPTGSPIDPPSAEYAARVML